MIFASGSGGNGVLISVVNDDTASPPIIDAFKEFEVTEQGFPTGIYRAEIWETCTEDYWGEVDCEFNYSNIHKLNLETMQWEEFENDQRSTDS